MLIPNLSVLLAERRLTISKVARDTGISRTTLTALAGRAARGIQFDTLDTLCQYLKVAPDALFIYRPFDLALEADGLPGRSQVFVTVTRAGAAPQRLALNCDAEYLPDDPAAPSDLLPDATPPPDADPQPDFLSRLDIPTAPSDSIPQPGLISRSDGPAAPSEVSPTPGPMCRSDIPAAPSDLLPDATPSPDDSSPPDAEPQPGLMRPPNYPAKIRALRVRLSLPPADDPRPGEALIALLRALPPSVLADLERDLLARFDAHIPPDLAPDDYSPNLLWPWEMC